jgi:hypothetical protein
MTTELLRRLRNALRSTKYRDELASLLDLPTTGDIYYVKPAAEGGSDSALGKSWDNAFATVEYALTQMTTNQHDVCVLSANAGHTLSDELVISKNRVHFVGTGFRTGAALGQRSRITMGLTTGSAIAAIKITGVADGGEFTIMRNCWVEKNEDLDQTGAAELLCNGDTSTYIGCTFGNMIYQPSVARQNVLFTRETIAGKVARSVTFEDCNFLGFPSATTFSHMRTANANDIERFCNVITSRFLTKVGGSIAAEAITIASALTDGGIFLDRCLSNATNIATASSTVYSNLPNSASLGGKVTEVT